MFEHIAGIIYEGLVRINSADLRKFKAHMENYYEELDKPSYEERHLYPNLKAKHFRDNNVIDRSKRGVYIIGKSYSSSANGGQSLRDLIKS